MALVGKKSHTAVRTSSRDQRETKGARWAIWVRLRAQANFTLPPVSVQFFVSLRFLREFYELTCCVGLYIAACSCGRPNLRLLASILQSAS